MQKKANTRRKREKSEGVTIIPNKIPFNVAGTTKFSRFFLKELADRRKEEAYVASLPPRHLKDGGILKVKSYSNLPPILNFEDPSYSTS